MIGSVVHLEFLPSRQTANRQCYLGVIRQLRENVCWKRPNLWKTNSWIFHDHNMPSHTSTIEYAFLIKNSTNVINQTSYLPSIATSDFDNKFKLPLHGRRFESIEVVKQTLQKELKTISESAYKKGFTIGLFVGISVLHQMESILKATKILLMKSIFCVLLNSS